MRGRYQEFTSTQSFTKVHNHPYCVSFVPAVYCSNPFSVPGKHNSKRQESILRVLIVDDHEFVRRGIRSLLMSRSGFEICGEAVDGRDALNKALLLKPDVITMDIAMPNLNGFDATRELHRTLPEIPVVVLSQHDLYWAIQEALNAGAAAYIVKSAVSKELIPALERIRNGESGSSEVLGSLRHDARSRYKSVTGRASPLRVIS